MLNPLYFIALLPDEEIKQEVTAFKQECAELFNASHALKSPPHVTLIPPFRSPPEKLDDLKSLLTDVAFDQFSFTVKLDGFNCYRPRVIFVDVMRSNALEELQKRLESSLIEKLDLKSKHRQGFNPHMTIAHRDLKEERFLEAWTHFSNRKYARIFRATGLSLMKHSAGEWKLEEHFDFG